MKTIRIYLRIGIIALMRFFVERYSYRASALAYTTLLALVPFLFVMVFFSTYLPFFASALTIGKKYILVHFVPGSASVIQDYLGNFLLQAVNLPTISIIFLFITALLMVDSIEETLNDIWSAQKNRTRFFPTLLLWFMLFLLPVFIGYSIYLSKSLFGLSWFSNIVKFTSLILGGMPIFINTIMFGVLYVIVPNAPVRWADGFMGGFVAAILFEIARASFALYVAEFPTYALIYGTFAIVPIFLAWLYVFWFILLFGALYANTHATVNTEIL